MKQDDMLRAIGGVEERFILEAADSKRESRAPRKKRYLALLVAATLCLLGTIAYAISSGYIRDVLLGEKNDVPEGAVQDVGAMGTDGDFRFTIDESYWEGDSLVVSYTAELPDDGEYLVGFHRAKLDGEYLDFSDVKYIEDGILLYADGSTRVLTGYFTFYPEAKGDSHTFSMEATLLHPAWEMKQMTPDEINSAYGSDGTPNGEIWYSEGNSYVDISLSRAVKERIEERLTSIPDAEFSFGGESLTPEKEAQYEEAHFVSVDDLSALGIASAAAQANVSFSIAPGAEAPVRSVAEGAMELPGWSVQVAQIYMTHMRMVLRIEATRVEEQDEPFPMQSAYFEVRDENGNSLEEPFSLWGFRTEKERDGATVVVWDFDGSGFLPTMPQQLVFVPYTVDDESNRTYREDLALSVTPASDAKEETLPNGFAYATEHGTYYHSDPECMGMRGAELVSIETATARGQKQCPVCWK